MFRLLLKVLIFIIFVFFILWLFWYFTPLKINDIFILDKTVLTKNGQEHRSLNWVLTNSRFVKPDSTTYKIDKDYWGFFPSKKQLYYIKDLQKFDENAIDSLSDKSDMAYFTDTYGIYWEEWQGGDYVTEHSNIIYGGMKKNEAEFLFKMKQKNKPIIMEFNAIASPTSYQVRKSVQDTFGFVWSGWTGRYFDSLDSLKNKELPKWLIKSYKEQYKIDWNFKRSGIVFVDISGKVLVLEYKDHLKYEVPFIETTEEYQKKFHVPQKIYYPFWFDVCYPKDYSQWNIPAYFNIYTTKKGDSLLIKNKLSKRFPAILLRKNDFDFTYFCADFADNKVTYFFSHFKWVDKIMKSFLYSPRSIVNRSRFFWKYYNPMMKVLLKEKYEIIKQNKIKTNL